MRRSRALILIVIALLTTLMPVSAAAAESNFLHAGFREILPNFQFVEDTQVMYEWQDFHEWDWQRVDTEPAQFGYTESAYWFLFTLEGDPDIISDAWVRVNYPLLDYLEFYLIDSNNTLISKYSLGDRYPFDQRIVKHPAFLIPLEDVSGDVTVLFRVRTESSLELPLAVISDHQLWSSMESTSWLQGLFFGAVLILGVYHILIFSTSGDRGYLYFGGLAAAMALIQATIWGRAYEFFWPNSPEWNHVAIAALVNFSNFFGVLYVTKVANIQHTYPRIYIISICISVVAGFMAICSLFLPYRLMIFPTLSLSLIIFCIGSIILFLRMRDRYPPAFAVFFAAAMYTLGSAAYILGKLEILPNSTLLENALAFGLLLQVMLFAFALSIRIGMERQLREEAQIETAHAKDMLLETERQQNIHLDKVVRSRTKQLEEVNERLQKISATDALTGLYNRRYFDESLKREYARAARNKTPLSVMMIDLDHFKSINDNYGHVFGDEALRQTALRMQDVLKRPGDAAFRYGGEEYVILLPDTNTSAARIIAKQIWSAMRSSQIFHDDQSETITVSIGIATVVPSPNGDPNKLLREADHKLYRAKEEGRDRICV